MKMKENALLWILSGSAVLALISALAANREPIGFFVTVRAIVCFASAYAGVKAYQARKEVWTWMLGANAVLFNPLIPIHLGPSRWQLVDPAAVALLIAAAVVFSVREERMPEDTMAKTPPNPPKPVQEAPEFRSPSRLERVAWITILALCLAGIFLLSYTDENRGTTLAANQNSQIGGMLFSLPFWAYIVARGRHWRRSGRIALGCFLAGLLASALGGFTHGFGYGEKLNKAEAAIINYDPALKVKLASTSGANQAHLSPAALRVLFVDAIRHAPDAAVVQFMAKRWAIIHHSGPQELKVCVGAFDGNLHDSLSAHDKLRMMQAMARLVSAAETARDSGAREHNPKLGRAALADVYEKVVPIGDIDDPDKLKALSDQEKCVMYTRLMQGLLSLPTKESAAAFRTMLSR